MFGKRSYEKELLDADNIPFNDIERNMFELNKINTLLGGHRITCKGVNSFVKKKEDKRYVIAEIGCGGGDNLFAVHRMLQDKKIKHTLIGIDIKPACIKYARYKYKEMDTEWICSDYISASWPDNKRPDIIFSSLFCHHFTDTELAEQLQWMQQNSRLGFFINDLQRHPVAYYSIKILTQLFSKSYLVKHDAPLSVKRGFKKNEWDALLKETGSENYKIKNEWAFRYLVSLSHE